jgi:hypothetical protein
MTDDEDQGGDPTEAFEALRAEVLLMRRDIAQLSAARQDVPELKDYDETLGKIMKIVSASFQRIDAMAASPALVMTPEHMASRIAAAAVTARQEDQRSIATARAALEDGARQLTGRVASARKGDKQNRWLAWSVIGGAVLGVTLWAAGAGVVARAVPAGWHWPERMAAQTLRLPMWDAGRQLAVTSSPETWNTMVSGAIIVQKNGKAIEACRKAAEQAGEAMRCTIKVDAIP